jgi:TRAP-type C4-dicarboxylate transport system permease small subunit
MIDGILDTIERWLAAAALAGCTLLVLLGAVARLAGTPIIWAIDIALLLFGWCCVLGADLALRRNGHIEIDVVVRRVPIAARRALGVVWLGVIAAFLAILVWYGVKLTLLNVERPLGDTEISYALVTASIPAGAGLMLWTVLRRLVLALKGRERLSLEGVDGRVL